MDREIHQIDYICSFLVLESTTTLYMDREIHQSVTDFCSPGQGLPSRGRCKSLTRGWIFLSLYKVVVDNFSPTTLNPHNKPTFFLLSKTTSKRFLLRKWCQLDLILTLPHCMIYGVIRRSLKWSCLFKGRQRHLGKDGIVNSTGNAWKTLSEVGESLYLHIRECCCKPKRNKQL